MMAQIAKLQEQMAAAQAEIAEAQITETAGGGAVAVTMTGDQRCTAVSIQEDVLKDADAEMLQDLISAAINDAMRQLDEKVEARMSQVTGGSINFPGF